jgi:hypothetical protein
MLGKENFELSRRSSETIETTLWSQGCCECRSIRGKVRKEVFGLYFQEARATTEGGDSSRSHLFLCQDI